MKMINKLILVFFAIVGIGIATPLFALAPAAISNIYIFGDSLSDAGFINNDPQVRAPNNTFTTPGGLVWSQQLGVDYGLPVTPNNNYAAYNLLHPTAQVELGDYVDQIEHGNDYAAGGAKTSGDGIGIPEHYTPPSINKQVASYLAQNTKADPNALYIIWGGANNILDLLAQGDIQASDYALASKTAATDIVSEIKLLKEAGAVHVLVIGLPNLGDTAEVAMLSRLIPGIKALTEAVSVNFNIGLNNAIANAGLTAAFLDTATIMSAIVNSNPTPTTPYIDPLSQEEITNVTDTACPVIPVLDALTCTPSAGTENYMFEDGVHPTAVLHKIIAKHIEDLIETTDF